MVSVSYVNSQETKYSYLSNVRKLNNVIPKGEVLGPLLFIIYINVIFYNLNNAHLTLYDGDSRTMVMHKLMTENLTIDTSLRLLF